MRLFVFCPATTMNIAQIQQRILAADKLWLARQLHDAEQEGVFLLETSTQLKYRQGQIFGHLFLAKARNTKARFENSKVLYPIVEQSLTAATLLNEQSNKHFHSEITQEKGHLHLNQKEFEAAKNCFEAVYAENLDLMLDLEIKSLVGLSQVCYYQNDFDEALAYVSQALARLEEQPSEYLQLEADCQLIQVYLRRREYSKLKQLNQAVLEKAIKYGDVEKEIIALNSTAVSYGAKSDFKEAVQYFLEALAKSRHIGFRQGASNSLINTATIYANLFNYDEALERYHSALKDFDDILDLNTKVIIFNNIGNIYYTQDKPLESLKYFRESYELSKNIGYGVMELHSLTQISRVLVAQKEYDEALLKAEQAQEIIEELGGDVDGKQINLLNMGNILYHKEDYAGALRLVSRGIVAAKQIKDTVSEIRGYRLMASIYEKEKNYQKAYEYHVVYAQARESFSKERRLRQTIDLEIKHSLEQKEKEIQLLTQKNNYQSLLLKQNEQINLQNEQLKEANEELRQFAYVASHDLKEPLRMIGSYARLLQMKKGSEIDEEEELYYGFLTDGVMRMKNLLDDLLRYATIGKRDVDVSAVDLNEVLRVVIENLTVSIEENGAEIKADALPTLNTNERMMSQLLQNLLSNAIKFRKPNTKPIIEIRHEYKDDKHLIRVIDNGIGIPKEYQERIFVIFQRLHKKTEYEGTGIGLSICQKIVKRLGGELWLESEDGKGTIFLFTLPNK